MRHFSKEKFQVFFENVLRFLSLRYSAEFRRSRLVFFSSDHRPHRVCTIFYRLHPFTWSVQSLLGLRWTQRSRVRVLALARNFFEQFFSGTLCLSRRSATFFRFFTFKGFHLQVFFDILQQTKVPKRPKGLPFYVFRYRDCSKFSVFVLLRKLKIRFFFVFKGPPFNLFDSLQQTGFSKSLKRSSFTGLKLRFLSLRYSADFRRSRLVFLQTTILTLIGVYAF